LDDDHNEDIDVCQRLTSSGRSGYARPLYFRTQETACQEPETGHSRRSIDNVGQVVSEPQGASLSADTLIEALPTLGCCYRKLSLEIVEKDRS
jgi:hypothetical protein